MNTELENQITVCEKEIRDRLDDYRDTVYAILGFCSLWFFNANTQTNRSEIKMFQGRHLSYIGNHEVCPDLGIVVRDDVEIIGEVKKNFPKNSDDGRKSIFSQLKLYDQELMGWPTKNEKLNSHDIVLLVHQTASNRALTYYLELNAGHKLNFVRDFAICEFNRSDQRVPYYFFKVINGDLPFSQGYVDLKNGVQVPMNPLAVLYAKSKLYDAEPPLAHLLQLIWEDVIIPFAKEDEKFGRLKVNQKIELNLKIDDIVEKLYKGYSFIHWHINYPERQPHIPHREWVLTASNFLVKIGKAKWITENEEILVYYSKLIPIADYFIKIEAELKAKSLINPMLPFDNVD